jgi:DNA-binding CsgD family transcriptional regulator
LTRREREVLGLLVGGSTAARIARQLRISERTVHKHLENVYVKLGVHDRLAAALRALELGLIDLGSPRRGLVAAGGGPAPARTAADRPASRQIS